jgi:2-polyprenyl-3-methyl-5-hydroxy-6-metoxy-1,4-benzoquinol methylase
MPAITTELDLDTLQRQAQAFAVISAWSAAGLFDELAANGPLAAEEMSGDTRAIQITAPILAHLGLLAGDESHWTLSQSAQRLHHSGALRLDSAQNSLGDLSRLDQILVEGGPAIAADGQPQDTDIGVRQDNPGASHQFMEFLHRRSGASAEEVARWLGPRLPPGARILDLGGGHGRYGQTLAAQGFQVTLFDLQVCIQYAQRRYGNSLDYIKGDFMQDPLGGPYDAVLVSNIMHGLGPVENQQLLLRLREALRPGGTLLLKDMFLDDSRIAPENAVFFGLLMLLYTRNGRSYSVHEITRLCEQTGFGSVRHIRVPDAGFSLLFTEATEKPAD